MAIGVLVLLASPLVRRWMHLGTLADRVSPEDATAVVGGGEAPATAGLPARG
jgi:hypothetical protein